jgi:hypothetical protein
MAGVEKHYITLPPETDIVAFILSQNVHRRHMTKGQRAMAVVIVNSGYSQREMAAIMDASQGLIMQASVVVKHAPDLVENVLSGATTLDAAYGEARSRKDIATSLEAQLGTLRAEAPDLASLVVEERLTVRDALALLDKRKAEKRREREAARQQLTAAVRFLAPPSGDIRAHAEKFLHRLDLATDRPSDPVTIEQIDRSTAFLAVVRDALIAQGEPHGRS